MIDHVQWRHHSWNVAALVVALGVTAATARWTSTSIGGADQYGYLSCAGLLQQGRLVVHQDIVSQSSWPFASGTWTPIGFSEVAGDRSAITPVYAPGLPLMIAGLQIVFGYCAGFWVAPLCAGAAVWLTYVLGRRVFAQRTLAFGASVLVAASPTFLNQAVAPLTDVPATTAWTLALVLLLAEWPLAAGAAASAAILIRPNLVPLVVALLAWTAAQDRRDFHGIASSRTARVALGIAPAVLTIALMNARLYGSPLRSGYGDLQDLYSWRYLWTNVVQFSTWTAETDTPIVVLAGLFFIAPRLLPAASAPYPRLLFGSFMAIVLLSYLFYIPFDAWWFLRFLLPMWPILMVLTVAALAGIAARVLPPRLEAIAVASIVAGLFAHGISNAAGRGTFDRADNERRYADVGRYIGQTTDPSSVFISWQESGSIRLYADRLTLNFARLDRNWLDRVVERLQAMGRHPYIAVEGFEADVFRRRFSAANRFGALDWTPIAIFENPPVAIYDPFVRTGNVRPAIIPASVSRPERHCRTPAGWPPPLELH